MRLTINKSVSKSVGIWTFLLLFILKGVFPEPAYALSSLDACAVKPECAEAIGLELSSTIAAPTAAGSGVTTISTTTAAGATSSSVQVVSGTTVVGDMRLTGVAAYFIWNKAQNQQAQNKAKERYCFFNALDMVCGLQGQSSVLYNYKFHQIVRYRRSHYPDKVVTHHYRSWRPVPGAIRSLANQYPGGHFGGGYPPSADYINWISLNDGDGNNQTRGVVYESSTGDPMGGYDYADYYNNNAEKGWISDLVRADGLPDNSPPRDWKDWPQEKRNAAVQLLNKSDWQGLITSMPAGGILNPGDKLKTKTVIIIPGQETDDPNTPADERLLKKQSGFFTFPGIPDFDKDGIPDATDLDNDNDGIVNTNDPAPRNPNVPFASSLPDESAKVTPEVLQDIRDIVDSFKPNENLQCVPCAAKIEVYLKEKGIHGERIILDTPRQTRYDDFIYDDSLPAGSDAIATNGHHEGIAIRINGEKRVFDNHHPEAVTEEQWINNLVFDSKIHFGASFKRSGYLF
ncbi:papain fold toxin domain-containing protein [Nostoc sp. LPT]|uniref:papain fold toxin domain-containing protein n=1 Tax=Nostoc sp. LPT TaxID=2815387 RepID=UPI0025F3854A|nr:papain fold toxin domain-containing protein [Nostoc sp. LPT]